MTKEQKIKKMNMIEWEVTHRYLDVVDYDQMEYMTDKEKEEYVRLYREVWGDCLTCGNDAKNCICFDKITKNIIKLAKEEPEHYEVKQV